MKNLRVFLVVSFLSINAFAMDADFSGYLRGGTGLNLQGGKQECFNNQGIPANFLRLGNECSFYSELTFIFNHKAPVEKDASFFRTQVRLMFGAQGTRQWEPESNRDMHQVEAFVTAGGFEELPGDIWVGKRFYRDVDLHIFDWYYYADMSGVGAGIENIKTDLGAFSFAHLIQTNDEVSTDVGKPTLQALDLRWKHLPAFGSQKLNFWGVYAWAPGGNKGATAYVPTNGYSLATRLEGPLGDGNNNFSVMYGKGTMKDFNIYANSALPATNDSQNRAWNVRIVNDWNKDVSDKWAIYLAAAGEFGDTGAVTDSQRSFYEAGVRPIYFVSDRVQWMTEFGFSRIKETEQRDLGRVTLASQYSIKKSMWGRPVLRAFVSHSFWNNENKTSVAKNAPTFADKNAGTSFGYQFEAWF